MSTQLYGVNTVFYVTSNNQDLKNLTPIEILNLYKIGTTNKESKYTPLDILDYFFDYTSKNKDSVSTEPFQILQDERTDYIEKSISIMNFGDDLYSSAKSLEYCISKIDTIDNALVKEEYIKILRKLNQDNINGLNMYKAMCNDSDIQLKK